MWWLEGPIWCSAASTMGAIMALGTPVKTQEHSWVCLPITVPIMPPNGAILGCGETVQKEW